MSTVTAPSVAAQPERRRRPPRIASSPTTALQPTHAVSSPVTANPIPAHAPSALPSPQSVARKRRSIQVPALASPTAGSSARKRRAGSLPVSPTSLTNPATVAAAPEVTPATSIASDHPVVMAERDLPDTAPTPANNDKITAAVGPLAVPAGNIISNHTIAEPMTLDAPEPPPLPAATPAAPVAVPPPAKSSSKRKSISPQPPTPTATAPPQVLTRAMKRKSSSPTPNSPAIFTGAPYALPQPANSATRASQKRKLSKSPPPSAFAPPTTSATPAAPTIASTSASVQINLAQPPPAKPARGSRSGAGRGGRGAGRVQNARASATQAEDAANGMDSDGYMAVTEEILPEDDEDTRATKTLLRESKMEANALKEMFDASMKEYFDLRAQEIEMEEQTANELAIPAEFLAEYEAIEAKYAQRLAVQDTYLKLRLAQAEAVFAAECKAADDTFINGARDVRLELEDELTRSKYALIREKQRLDSLPEEPTTFDVVVGSKKRRAEEMQAPRVIRPRYAEKEDLELLSSTCQKV